MIQVNEKDLARIRFDLECTILGLRLLQRKFRYGTLEYLNASSTIQDLNHAIRRIDIMLNK